MVGGGGLTFKEVSAAILNVYIMFIFVKRKVQIGSEACVFIILHFATSLV